MTRLVKCRKYNQKLEGLDMPPLPGNKGIAMFENVSKKAWQEWLTQQTMLINEKQLNLMDPQSRTYLADQMEKFLSGENIDEIEGYIPPEK